MEATPDNDHSWRCIGHDPLGDRQNLSQFLRRTVAETALLRTLPSGPALLSLKKGVCKRHFYGFGASRSEPHDVSLPGEVADGARQKCREFAFMAPERALVSNPREMSLGKFLCGGD